MEEQDNKKQKTGCGRFILVAILIYAAFCLVYFLIEQNSPGGMDGFLNAIGIIVIAALVVAGIIENR
jgi:heme/copper-type cytochrome/quinol oxidase subunit 4